MDLNLNGKKAIVCGSTQGIGKAAAIELALLGASITLVARNEVKLKSVVGELQVYSGQTHDYIVADFNYPDDLKLKIEKYVQQNTIHILVNNTGGPPPGTAIDAKPDEFMKAFSSHLICNQILVQACLEGMKSERYGRIINVISTSVKIPIRGLGVSNTIRGAVANWAKTLSMELGQYGITVNNVLPGSIMTGRNESMIKLRAEKTGKSENEIRHEMEREIPLGRIGEPAEIGAVIAFLATPAASYVSGINVPVDGGRTACL